MKDIEKYIEYIDKLPLECDGATRLVRYELLSRGIEHKCFVGSVEFVNQQIPLHFWVEIGDFAIDYRLKMWLKPMGGAKIPNGIFYKPSEPLIEYKNPKDAGISDESCAMMHIIYGKNNGVQR